MRKKSISSGSRRRRTVDVQLGVADNLLDLALLLEVLKSLTGEGAVDLKTVDKGGDGNETVGLDVLVETLSDGLLEDNGVLGLVLDLALGPLLACGSHLDCLIWLFDDG